MMRGAAMHPMNMPTKYAEAITPMESGGKCAAVALSGISVFDSPLPAIRMKTAAECRDLRVGGVEGHETPALSRPDRGEGRDPRFP